MHVFDTPQIRLRIHAERVIRADRLARGADVSHLRYEAMVEEAARDLLAALQRINHMADILFGSR